MRYSGVCTAFPGCAGALAWPLCRQESCFAKFEQRMWFFSGKDPALCGKDLPKLDLWSTVSHMPWYPAVEKQLGPQTSFENTQKQGDFGLNSLTNCKNTLFLREIGAILPILRGFGPFLSCNLGTVGI